MHYFAHAQTSFPSKQEPDDYYLQGSGGDRAYFINHGIPGYTSFCGHLSTSYLRQYAGHYLDEEYRSIWCNEAKNFCMMDCGCGFASGRLACFCIETGERWYA